MKLKYFLSKFNWMGIYNSPFKRPKIKFYIGKVKLGVPIFYPRVVNKKTNQFEPKKIGFDFVGLGYKAKWNYCDYRFEWSPIWSFVFFKWQIALIFTRPSEEASLSNYWEGWLYYKDHTEGTKLERLYQAVYNFPMMVTKYKGDEKIKLCEWDPIIKPEYVQIVEDAKRAYWFDKMVENDELLGLI